MLIVDLEDCTGCGACQNICPADAITMRPDSEGFLYPQVSESCVNCNLCNNICPLKQREISNRKQPECYAAWIGDEKTRLQSSSGGVFTALAEYVFARGGYVCGVKYVSQTEVRHVLISSPEDLPSLRGSKYVQSEVGLVFREIKQLLDQQKLVLFVGTPCQVAGLKAFLRKPYDSLLTVDLVCHGVPSPLALAKYSEENGCRSPVLFRDKTNGWHRWNLVYDDKKIYHKEDPYIQAFLRDLSLRRSCANCHYAGIPRPGDFTLGDYWGIENYEPKLNDDKGTSLILVNNDKAAQMLQELDLAVCKPMPLPTAVAHNYTLQNSFPLNPDRAEFFAALSENSFSHALQKAAEPADKVAVLNFWWSLNYGASLTAYALQQTISGFGFRPRLIHFVHAWAKDKFPGSFSESFARKYLKTTVPLHHPSDFADLNDQFSAFVVGSDQVFRHEYIKEYLELYLLSFTRKEKKRLSVAASFGGGEQNIPVLDRYFMQNFLQRFNHLSVRETQGQDLCRNLFGLEAECLLDPVFYLSAEQWSALAADSSKVYPARYQAAYILDQSEAKAGLTRQLAENLSLDSVNLENGIEVVDWLKAIAGAELLITDSFHGVCFAIIFQKPFICINNQDRGADRFTSLFARLGIPQERLIDLPQPAPLKVEPIDYSEVLQKIDQEVRMAKDFIARALSEQNSPPQNPEDKSRELQILIKKYRKSYLIDKILSKLLFGNIRKRFRQKAKITNIGLKRLKRWLKELNKGNIGS